MRWWCWAPKDHSIFAQDGANPTLKPWTLHVARGSFKTKIEFDVKINLIRFPKKTLWKSIIKLKSFCSLNSLYLFFFVLNITDVFMNTAERNKILSVRQKWPLGESRVQFYCSKYPSPNLIDMKNIIHVFLECIWVFIRKRFDDKSASTAFISYVTTELFNPNDWTSLIFCIEKRKLPKNYLQIDAELQTSGRIITGQRRRVNAATSCSYGKFWGFNNLLLWF